MAFSTKSLALALLAAAAAHVVVAAPRLEARNNCFLLQTVPVDLSDIGYHNQCSQASTVCRCVESNPADSSKPNRLYCLGGNGGCDAPGDFIGII